jgi:hypothetical protein
VASGTVPPVVHALTVHCATCPRSLLACAGATWTQRLVGVVSETVLAPLCELVAVAVAVAVGVAVLVAVPVAVGEGLGVAGLLVAGLGVMVRVGSGVAVSVDLTSARVRVGVAFGGADFVVAAVGLDFSVRVGAECAAAFLLGVAVGVPEDVVGVGVGVAVGVGVVVGVAAGVGEPEDGGGDGLDDTVDCNGSHDSPLGVAAGLAAAECAVTARLTPDAAVRSTLPAISVTVAGRACPKRMKRCPYQCFS